MSRQVLIPAEIEPLPGLEHQAASVLSRMGVEVMYVGSHVSVRAPREVWTRILAIDFEKVETRRSNGSVTSTRSFYRPVPPDFPIPASLASCIRALSFTEPPDLLNKKV